MSVRASMEAATVLALDDGYRPSGAPWESYLDEPDVSEPRTMVYLPCVAIRHG